MSIDEQWAHAMRWLMADLRLSPEERVQRALDAQADYLRHQESVQSRAPQTDIGQQGTELENLEASKPTRIDALGLFDQERTIKP